jgi:hypothetical protein
MTLREDLLQSWDAGNFLKAIYTRSFPNHSDHAILQTELIALHHEGLIDIIAEFASLKNNSTDQPDLFITKYIFENTLPELVAAVKPVMSCLIHLFQEAGQDLAAYSSIECFTNFCEREPSRPQEALVEIEASPNTFAELLPATLIAGSRIDFSFYLHETIRLCEDKNAELKRLAVHSVGKLNWPQGLALMDYAFTALENINSVEIDDQILSCVIKSAFSLFQQDKTQEQRAITLIDSTLRKGGDCALLAASEIFGLHSGELPTILLDAVFRDLMRIKPQNRRILNNVDIGISHLLKKGDLEKAIHLLEALLLEHPNKISMEDFKTSSREILNDTVLINKVLTRWFLSGDWVLCDGVRTIIEASQGDDMRLEVDKAELSSSDDNHILFVARKAIGFLFTKPITAVTILLSLMRNTQDDQILENLGDLLFDPLLLNFTGKARDYVVQQCRLESGEVKVAIDKVLTKVDEYLEDLYSVGNLAALHPSETHREAYHRFISQKLAESWKAAEAQSVFLSSGMVSKYAILYGRKTINYVYASNGQTYRMENDLQNYRAELEIPRMQQVDPFMLGYILRTFKTERFK